MKINSGANIIVNGHFWFGCNQEICEIIGPELKRLGLIFTGIDVIDGYLTEINVTSPTGLQEINRFNNVKLEASIWDAIEMQLI